MTLYHRRYLLSHVSNGDAATNYFGFDHNQCHSLARLRGLKLKRSGVPRKL